MRGPALLVIWSDVAADSETDYLHWLTREHAQERITTDGFVAVRVFRAELSGVQRYLIVYDLSGADALDGPDYLRKLNDPTPWSQRIMPSLRNFMRGGGRVVASAGAGRGGFAAAITLDHVPQNAREIAENLVREDRLCSVQFMQTNPSKTDVATREKAMRKGDRSFAGLVIIDGLDPEAVTKACARLTATASPLAAARDTTPVLYRQVFSLERRMIEG